MLVLIVLIVFIARNPITFNMHTALCVLAGILLVMFCQLHEELHEGRALLVEADCGLGHVLSSVFLGLAGVLLGIQVMKLEVFEAFRGSIAAWLLIGFGFAYFLWGIRRAILNRPHRCSNEGQKSVENDAEQHREGTQGIEIVVANRRFACRSRAVSRDGFHSQTMSLP